ncbi:MAG: 50S ribosomal protein L4, partial [Candidatus Caldarchaeum sp.]
HPTHSYKPPFTITPITHINEIGTPKYGAGGMVPSAVGGRPTHPPTPEKKIHKQINKKELRNALLAALAFTASPQHVKARGHRIAEQTTLPIIVDDGLEALSKTAEARNVLTRLGLGDELKRCGVKKVRAGKGKMRGRRYKRRKGPLIVVAADHGVGKAASNIPGVEVVTAKDLSVLHLAPGAKPGRLTLFTKSALKALEERLK